jgi:Putative O-methyltransferase
MSSTNIINFSLRQNKCIERAIAFDCIAEIVRLLELHDLVYAGFGSVWFADFTIAHRLLGVETMVSIEHDDVVFKRANFNKLYRTLEIVKGESCDVIPPLVARKDLANRPWILWLDYDDDIDRDKLDELVELIRILPENSIMLSTFTSQAAKYGRNDHRPEYLSRLFELSAPEELSPEKTRNQNELSRILAESTESFLVSAAIRSGRPGSFIPAVNLMYRDTAPMVTIGGVLPSAVNEASVRLLVNSPEWAGRSNRLIQAPHLTPREVLAIQAGLPSKETITRTDVQEMGFDLHEEQLDSFVEHYIRYPQFAQVAQ